MLKTILRALFGDPRPPRQLAIDEVLGDLVPGEDGWTARVPCGADVIEFTIGGENEPAPALIAHAREIVGNYEAFKTSVSNCIETESRDYPEEVKEILAELKIDNVSLCCPERPDDGMIFFRGPADDLALWRCDYVAGKPQCLGCDT